MKSTHPEIKYEHHWNPRLW